MRPLITFLLLHFGIYLYGQSVIFVDSETKIPLEFVSFYSDLGSCYGYSDRKGNIDLGKYSFKSLIHFEYLGYKSKNLEFNSIFLLDTIFMERISYNLEEIKITANKINIIKELNQITKHVRSKKNIKAINTYFFLESFEDDSLLEQISLIGADMMSSKKMIRNNRVVGSFLIKKEKPYFSLDLDKFIKEISFYSYKRGQTTHLFSKRKINKKKFLIRLLQSKNGNRLIQYQGKKDNIHGYVKYNFQTKEIFEHKFTINKNLDNIFNSLNKSYSTIVDSISLHYIFKKNDLDIILFKIWIQKHSSHESRNLVTTGYLKVLNDERFLNKIEIPNLTYSSLQEELMYTSPINYLEKETKNLFKIDSSLYYKTPNNNYLSSNTTLSYNILKFFNNFSRNRKIWSRNKRLTINDFEFKESVKDYYNNNIEFLSDLQRIEINWIIVQNIEGEKVTYYSQNSIINNPMILYYGIRQAELVVNIYFDIFEIFRKRLIDDLNKKQIYSSIKIINKRYKEASQMAEKFIKGTNYARDLIKTKKYNDYIIDNLGIDNIKIVMSKIYDKTYKKNKFSEGDMLAFFGNYDSAISIYLEYLDDHTLDKKIKENILFNLCVIYKKLGEKDKLCYYYNELLNNNPKFINNEFETLCLNTKF